jgi:hypothetical protein
MSVLSRASLPLSPLLGAGAVFATVPLIGYTMAIAAPSGLLRWLTDAVNSEFAGFSWDVVVVFGPTVGLLVFLAALAVRLICRTRPGSAALLLLGAGALVALYLLVPLAYAEPFMRPLPWWASAAEASILIACIAAFPLLRRRHSQLRVQADSGDRPWLSLTRGPDANP